MKVVKIILIVLAVLILSVVGYLGYQIFVKAGFKPWNKKANTVSEMYDYAKMHNLQSNYTAYVNPKVSLYSFNIDSTNTTGLSFPMCRVFDAQGHLYYEAKCFESIPVFLDSLDAPDCFYFRGTNHAVHFDDFGSKLLTFTNNKPLVFNQLEQREFYIVYCWSNVLGHSVKKYHELKTKLESLDRNIGLISVNMSLIKKEEL